MGNTLNNFMFIILGFILTGCSNNPFVTFFATNNAEKLETFRDEHPECFLSNKHSIKVYKTDYDKQEQAGDELFSNGYVYIGSSGFSGKLESISKVREAAKKLGAIAVIYSSQFKDIEQDVGFINIPQTTYSHSIGTTYGYGTNIGRYSATTNLSTVTTKNNIQAIPYQYETYYQVAHFFVNCD